MANYIVRETNLHSYNFFFSLFFFYAILLIFSQESLVQCVTLIFNDKANINRVPTVSQTFWEMHVSGNKTGKILLSWDLRSTLAKININSTNTQIRSFQIVIIAMPRNKRGRYWSNWLEGSFGLVLSRVPEKMSFK